jgi:hypothetical protein
MRNAGVRPAPVAGSSSPTANVVVVVVAVVVVVVAVAVVVVVVVPLSSSSVVRSQPGWKMVLLSKVSADTQASARPSIVAPEFTVIESRAMIVPTNEDPDPTVAELPTCQNTLHA